MINGDDNAWWTRGPRERVPVATKLAG